MSTRAQNRTTAKYIPGDLAIDGLPSILEVIGVGPAVHLAVELGVDNGAGILVEWVRVVANPGAGEEGARGLVGLEHWAVAVVVIVGVVVAQHQHNGGDKNETGL